MQNFVFRPFRKNNLKTNAENLLKQSNKPNKICNKMKHKMKMSCFIYCSWFHFVTVLFRLNNVLNINLQLFLYKNLCKCLNVQTFSSKGEEICGQIMEEKKPIIN